MMMISVLLSDMMECDMKVNNRLNNKDSLKLIENPDYLDHVKKIAWHYYRYVPDEKRGLVTIEDLVSAGYEGLMIAAGRYDPKIGVKFTTFSSKWIKGEMIKEMIFYIGKDALLFDNEKDQMLVSDERGVEDTVISGPDISEIPPEEQVKIIKHKLNEYKLTKEEITVYMAVNGIGCSRVTNLRVLGRQLKKREMDIRRIEQSAENKLKKSMI